MDSTQEYLSETWKDQFFRRKPIIPGVIQLATALAIIIVGCFGEIHVGAPWWSGILFLVSGISLCLLIVWPIVKMEVSAFVAAVLGIVAAVAAIIAYSVEFTIPALFPHDHSNVDRLVLTYHVDITVLALCAFQLGISVYILSILILTRRAASY
ncbi:uncharacterized protein O3C94_007665 isoform 1-T4 [Discoglossus pictus]